MTEKERYATIGTWEKVFREEGVNVNKETIRRRLSDAGIIGETARSKVGRVIREGFYAESDIRKLLTDLLHEIPQADRGGFIERNQETYGTIKSLSELLGISRPTIRQRIKENGLKPIQGRDAGGRVFEFYPLTKVRELCVNLVMQVPQADENGFFEKDGKIYGTFSSLSRLLGISATTVQSRIQKKGLQFVRGKIYHGQPYDFYLLPEVQKLCVDLIQDLPSAGQDGILVKDGETYGTIESLSRLFSISATAIQSRIQKSTLRSIQGRCQSGNLCNFYSLTGVRELCQNLLQNFPQADEEGIFKKDGEIYGTLASLSRLIGISAPTVQSRIRKSSLESTHGKDSSGQAQYFYPFSKVSKLCADLIAKRNKE